MLRLAPIVRSSFVIGVLLVHCIQSPAALAVEDANSDRPPNVIIIFADDLGYGDLGCYGHPDFKTPRIDRMAAEGVKLTQFYVPVPFCAPSRATLLTGRYPFRNGVMTNPAPDADASRDKVGISEDEVLLGEALQAKGYATACIGKWHLGHQPQFYPTRHGFDEYYGILYSNDMRPVQILENETVVEYPVVQATLTRRYTERAIDFISRHKDRPFFLYLPHAMPHKPLACTKEFYKKSGAGLYADVMAELDWSVGKVFDALNENGIDENTLVIFTSDNGPWFGGSTGGLRGMKGRTWEGGIRVPMIARWPGKLPQGETRDAVRGTIDLFPTILKLAGGELPDDRKYDGFDLWPVLTGESNRSHDAIFTMRNDRLMAVRSGDWKLHVRSPGPRWFRNNLDDWVDPRAPDGVTILAPYEQYQPRQYPGRLEGDGPRAMMLFNLKTDPAEEHDVAAEHPEIVTRLKKLYDETAAQFPK